MIDKPGIYADIPPTEYHAGICPERALSSTAIKTLLTRTPADYRYGVRKSTPAMKMGDVAHQIALKAGKGFAIAPYDDWRTKDAKAFRDAAIESGLTPIKQADYEVAETLGHRMRLSLQETLSAIGASYGVVEPEEGFAFQTEAVMAWQEQTHLGPIWCCGMMDVWCAELGVILDPKFSNRVYPGVIEGQMAAMGWDMQAAFYRRGAEAIWPEQAGRIRFVNLVMSPDAPHVSRAVEIDEAWRYSCESEINRAIRIFAECSKRDVWPGFRSGVETISARNWTIAERMARELEDESDDA
jgi:hypothetical protein